MVISVDTGNKMIKTELQDNAAARSVISTKTATTSSSVKDHERWITLRENTFPTVSTRISNVVTTSTTFSTAASAFMSFL